MAVVPLAGPPPLFAVGLLSHTLKAQHNHTHRWPPQLPRDELYPCSTFRVAPFRRAHPGYSS